MREEYVDVGGMRSKLEMELCKLKQDITYKSCFTIATSCLMTLLLLLQDCRKINAGSYASMSRSHMSTLLPYTVLHAEKK